MSDKKKIGFFYGGNSVEHEVSIESAKNVIGVLLKDEDLKIYPIYIDKKGRWYLTTTNLEKIEKLSGIIFDFERGVFITKDEEFKIDLAFSIIHGNGGEDGKLQSFFEMIGVYYSGCGVLASSISMNKKFSKMIAKLYGVPVLDDVVFSRYEYENDFERIEKKIIELGFPVFVKPVSLGSSVGVNKVVDRKFLKDAIEKSLKYEYNVMVEKGVDRAREIVCGIIGDDKKQMVSLCGEVVVNKKYEFYDYNAKYLDDNAIELKIPAEIDEIIADKIKNYTKTIFKSFWCYGFARVDFLMDKDKNVYFCEINTIPGFTSHSLFPSLFKKTGISIEDQIKKIIELSYLRNKI